MNTSGRTPNAAFRFTSRSHELRVLANCQSCLHLRFSKYCQGVTSGVFVSGFYSILAIILFSFLNAIVFPAFFAYISDLSRGENQASGAGFLFGTSMLASAVSPAVVGALIDFSSFQTAFSIMPIVSLLSIIPLILLPTMVSKKSDGAIKL